MSPEYLYPAKSAQLHGQVYFNYWMADGSSKNGKVGGHQFFFLPSQWLFMWLGRGQMCRHQYLQTDLLSSSFNFQRQFPVLEEGIFAKNIALDHVSSMVVTLLDFLTMHPASTSRALAQPQNKLRVLEGIYTLLLQAFL